MYNNCTGSLFPRVINIGLWDYSSTDKEKKNTFEIYISSKIIKILQLKILQILSLLLLFSSRSYISLKGRKNYIIKMDSSEIARVLSKLRIKKASI